MRSIYLMGFDRVRRPAKAALIAMVVSAAAGGSVLFASLASGASAGRAQTTASVVTKNSLIAKSQLQLRDRQLTPKDQLAEGLVESAGAESSAPPLVTSLPSGIWDTPQPPFRRAGSARTTPGLAKLTDSGGGCLRVRSAPTRPVPGRAVWYYSMSLLRLSSRLRRVRRDLILSPRRPPGDLA